MRHRASRVGIVLIGCVTLIMIASAAFAEDLGAKSCSELLRMAQAYQQDLKTVDIVLGSAIDAGNLDRVRSYKLRKNAVRRDLEAVLRALSAKECISSR
jgi:hypothetical protein